MNGYVFVLLVDASATLLMYLLRVKHDILAAFNSALLSQQSTTLLHPRRFDRNGLGLMIKTTMRWQIIRQSNPSLKACRTNCAEHTTYRAIVCSAALFCGSCNQAERCRGPAMAMRQLGREFRANVNVSVCPLLYARNSGK